MSTPCFHCHLPSPETAAGPRYQRLLLGEPRTFCCPGCEAVAVHIVESGLDGYYLNREEAAPTARPPEPNELLVAFDHPSVQRDFVHQEEDCSVADLSLEGLGCAACAWLIERRLGQLPAVAQATVNLSNHRLRLVWRAETLPLSQILATLEQIGYRARPFRPDAHAHQLRQEARQQLTRVAVAGLGTMQAMMYGLGLYLGAFQGIEEAHRDYLRWISGLVTTPVFFYAGWPFYRAAWRALKARSLVMDVPVSIALIMAFSASWLATWQGSGETYFDSVCMFIFFLLTSRYLELRARQQAGETAAGLITLAPRLAQQRQPDQSWRTVSVDQLAVGDELLVSAGDTLPVDAVLLSESASLSEALLTGEPLPVHKHRGDTVVGGSINGDQAIQVRVLRVGQDTVLATLKQLLARALSEKPLLAQKADRMARWFVARVLVLSLLVYVTWWFIDASQAFWITIAVLVATCPCALSLATPVALTTATHRLAREGFLVTRGHVLDALSGATHVLFDKTGTLTEGQFSLEGLALAPGMNRHEVLSWIAALEQGSHHPIARALNRAIAAEGIAPAPLAAAPTHHPGAGMTGEVAGRTLRLGHAQFALGQPVDQNAPLTLWLADDSGHVLASLSLIDRIRPEARGVIDALKARGLTPWLVSGDPSATPLTVGQALGIDEVRAGVTPDGKQAVIRDLQAQGAVVVMVGDGVNDAPALGLAHLGIAMGTGTDLTHTSADAILLGDRLSALAPAFHLAQRTEQIIRQNLRWALIYNLSILPPAALGYVPPWLAALGMSASSLVVVMNALRLKR